MEKDYEWQFAPGAKKGNKNAQKYSEKMTTILPIRVTPTLHNYLLYLSSSDNYAWADNIGAVIRDMIEMEMKNDASYNLKEAGLIDDRQIDIED